MKIITRILLGLIIAATLLPLAAGAAPYTTYTYSKEQGPDGNATILTSPDAYVPDRVITSDFIGLGETPFDDPRDIFVGPDEKVYLVDAANARVIVMDRYYKLDFIIDTIGLYYLAQVRKGSK